jgi:dTMP kinase
MGIFITFEGIEGCGKSYQSKALYRKLLRTGHDAILTQEPGGTPLGNAVRRLLKGTVHRISAEAELFLFNASRAQLAAEILWPGLEAGKIIVCDRYTDSTVVYQGYGRKLELDSIKYLNEFASGRLKPDLTILLDLPVNVGLERKKAREGDRFDAETLAFHERVRRGFIKLARQEPKRWMVIDGLLSRSAISRLIWQRVEKLLTEKEN